MPALYKRFIYEPKNPGAKTQAPKRAGEKKPARRPVLSLPKANYLAAAEAAEAAAEAAALEAAAASAAAEAACEAAAEASVAAGAGVTTAGAAGAVSATGAGATTTGSSFLLQAARATAIREMISRDFFMDFPLIVRKVETSVIAMNNYR
jgi:hypothetical protein